MEVYAVLDDGESQTGPALAAAALVDAVEAFENAVHVFFRDASRRHCRETEVVEFRVLLVATYREMDAFARIRDRVVIEIAEDRVEQRIIAIDREVARKSDLCRDLLFFLLARPFMSVSPTSFWMFTSDSSNISEASSSRFNTEMSRSSPVNLVLCE